MLLDKSGMRKKDKSEKSEKRNESGKGFKQKRGPKTMSAEEAHRKAIQTALKYGIGYQQYKKEVDAIRAAQIRAKLEKEHLK